jgi:CBS-domain-containing membrane protein
MSSPTTTTNQQTSTQSNQTEKNQDSPRGESDNEIYYTSDLECSDEECQSKGHPCMPDDSCKGGRGEPPHLQGTQGNQGQKNQQGAQSNQGAQGKQGSQQSGQEGQANQQGAQSNQGGQQQGNQGRGQRRQRNQRQRQQRLRPQGDQDNQGNQQGGQGGQKNQGNQQGGQQGQGNQQGGQRNQGRGNIGFNEGIQGPFGRFRGESVSTWTEKMPCSIKELFEQIPLEAMMIENWVRKRLVLIGDKQPLDKALQRLNRHKITSLPVINEETGNIKGLLDSLDIVNYLCSVLDQESIAPARWDFNLQSTGQLLEMSQKKAYVISNNANMYDGLQQLSKGIPRLLVSDGICNLHQQENEEQSILGMFTQSDIVRFLASNPYWLALAPNAQKTLKELDILKDSSEQVVSVDQSIPANQAFKKIADTNSTGIVVNDSQGRIVANLSAANIRGISRRNFQLLTRPLFEFLQRDRRRGWWTMPICIRETDTLEKCILQFGATKVHQMYVCDDNGKATNVVTLTDVLRQFVTQGTQA